MQPFGPVPKDLSYMLVSDLIDSVTKTWNWNLILEVILGYEHDIKQLPPILMRGKDKCVWLLVKSVEYATRSCYVISSINEALYLI